MSCLALSLQPSDGSDILLQTREWFPPARALVALSAFRNTRLAFSSLKQQQQNNQQQLKKKLSSSSAPSLTEEIDSSLGDDPLAASSGQVIVGVESQYLVVYRLVNGVYVLGITTADHRHNVFDCINTVNQAVNVIVAACRGVDVTPEKIHRKYPEVYMALDIVLRGVGAVRLAAILGSLHSDSIAKMLHAGIDSEIRVRGADNWAGGAEISSIERKSTLEAFSNATFEMPSETLAVGDEAAAAIAPPSQQMEEHKSKDQIAEDSSTEKDPFAASNVVNKPIEETLMGGFNKVSSSTSGGVDLTLALAGLDVALLPPAGTTKSTFVAVEGFEGEYGGVEFGKEEASLSEAFEVFDDSFGGGLDASEFVETKKKKTESQGLGGVELLLLTQSTANGGKSPPVDDDKNRNLKSAEMKGPEMQIVEEISAEFRESLLARVALQGTVYLRTLPAQKKTDGQGDKETETEFSFKFGTTPGVKRVAMQSSRVSSLGDGVFHVKTPSMNQPIAVLRYSLQPRFTPIPLRVRLIQRHTGTLLSVMIQYASNPELPHPLANVKFVLKLPVDPTLLTVSPKAQLNREKRELSWVVPDIPLTGSPGKLRARMPVDQDSHKGEDAEVVGMVIFSVQGTMTLSGVSLQAATEGRTDDFYTVNHIYCSQSYVFN
ncbi:hypothetical protein ZOSMA_294G00220 [Zostera marina]|uniref:MHD domain-containing protein n=1 Tax=Zostera marina TaxID=29655 RepID=A0A0K9PEB7_ZOSMR|nr:hypothetical protein ZOSMA_294G00220 [Zostera marina]